MTRPRLIALAVLLALSACSGHTESKPGGGVDATPEEVTLTLSDGSEVTCLHIRSVYTRALSCDWSRR